MATRFWVGGTGTWDASDTTHWAASSNAAGGQSVPGSTDTVTFDASSGGGTVTVNTIVDVTSITMGAFTGTLDFSVNNNNVTIQTFSGSGSGTRTLKMGSGIWTVTGASGTIWTFTTITNLTFNAGSSTLVFSATTASTRTIVWGVLAYATVNIGANTSGGILNFSTLTGGSIATLSITGPVYIAVVAGATLTITNAPTINGSSGNEIVFGSQTLGTAATISSANNGTFSWCAFRDTTFSGGGTFTASNSFDLGHNSGITITAPSAGGGLIVHPGMSGGCRG